VLADGLGLETLDREGSAVVLKFREKKTTVDPVRIINLVKERDDLRLFPPATLKLDLSVVSQGPDDAGAEAPALRTSHALRAGQTGRPGSVGAERRGFTPGAAGAPGPRPGGRILRPARKPAWWAARATAGAVTPGFSKAEMLKAAPEDPRAPDGVLDRVTGLLLALSDAVN